MNRPYAVGVRAGLRSLAEADHLLRTLAPVLPLAEPEFGCTHLVRGDRPQVALSFSVPTEALLSTVRQRLADQGYEAVPGVPDAVGRAVLYPGAARLTGTLTVAEVLSASAIDRVTVLGSPGPVDPDRRLVTRDHVRPQWQDGELVLAAMPAVGGTLVPFEVPNPTPCCANH
ncbi:hypothetical protein [Streptomyces sp. NPDC059786]|uniref:hypothetical protein n=1 Tax=Streptomyces sp. NPDC059786 TaxID=3346946 RepID=UPI00364B3714